MYFLEKQHKHVGFKQNKTSKYTKKNKGIPYTVGILGIFSIFVLGISISNAIKHIDFDLVSFQESNIISGVITPNKKADANKINVLVLGRGGGEHDAPDLTDTIILASINLDEPSISMLSIPRDLYVEYKNGERAGKINRVYEDSLLSGEKYAIEEISSKVSEITGQKIDYYVNVDFEGFVEIIDVLDGIDVEVSENLVDNNFPDGNLGYTTFILRAGSWTLDGETALKYARSRYSTSDFDRSLRQQQIIKAVQSKILGLGYLKSPTKTKNLYNAIRRNIKTDLDIKTILSLANTFTKTEKIEVLSYNLNDSCFYGGDCSEGGLLYYPERALFNNQSVLLAEGSTPNNLSNYERLQAYTNLIFNETQVFKEDYPINIFNATSKTGIAGDLADKLNRFGFNVPEKSSLGNIRDQEFETSIIYYNGIAENSATLTNIKDFINIDMEEVEFPLFSSNIETSIEIVLGEDYEDILKGESDY